MKFLLGFLMMFFSSVAIASDADGVTISEPFARASMQYNSAAFMSIVNNGDDTAIVAARSAVSEVVELHTHREESGVMRMRQVEKIDLPSGETVMLKPGGLHVMLIGLKQALEVDTEISVTLIYADGSETSLMMPVVNVMRGQGMSHGSGQMKGDGHGQGMKQGKGMAQGQGGGRNKIKGGGYEGCGGMGHGEGYAHGKGHGMKHGEGYQHGKGHGKKHGEGYAHGKGHGMKHGKAYEQCEGHSQVSQ